MFDRVLKMLLTGMVLTHFIRHYLFKVSRKTSGRGLFKYFSDLIALNMNK